MPEVRRGDDLGVLIAARMRSMQGFQMLMNFLIMPLYFLSGAMFPLVSAPRWMQVLMRIDPLTYGVDALRNVIYSETTTLVAGSAVSLVDMARESGLIRWGLGVDLAFCTLVAGLLSSLARMDKQHQDRLVPIKGVPPSLAKVPIGCAFHPRCAFATAECKQAIPPLERIAGNGHLAACVHSDRVGVAYEERFAE